MSERPLKVYVIQGRGERDYADCQAALARVPARLQSLPFIGDPDVSEAVYRLLKAAREGRRAQEEVRVAGLKSKGQRWLRLRARPLGNVRRGSRLTLWTIADVPRAIPGVDAYAGNASPYRHGGCRYRLRFR